MEGNIAGDKKEDKRLPNDEDNIVPSSSSLITVPEKATKKRPRLADDDRRNDPYVEAYHGWSFQPVESTGRPGTPHRYFSESYRVIVPNSDETIQPPTKHVRMRVHKHANGLCIVTVDDQLDDVDNMTEKDDKAYEMEFCVKEASDIGSAAAKRKRAAAMLRKKPSSRPSSQQQGEATETNTLADVVRPNDTILRIHQKEATVTRERTIEFPACVFGTIMETNPHLTTDKLRKDPLLQGYLVVILPSGPFPPSNQMDKSKEVHTPIDDINE
jgi:hypothetical protein